MIEQNGKTTAIQGNTRDREHGATVERDTNKMDWKNKAYNFGLAATLVITGIVLANVELSFFWNCVLGIGLIYGSSKIIIKPRNKTASALWNWQKIVRVLGWIVLFNAIFGSGIIAWVESSVVKIEEYANCSSNQACVDARKAREKAEKAEEAEERRLSRQAYEAPVPTATESACGTAFAAVKDCKRIAFRNGGTFDYRALTGHCPGYDRKNALNITPIEDGFTHAYSSRYPNRETVVHFYSLKPGQAFLGYTCPS